ncbi:MAG: transcriptional regulator [Bacteroidetes bacterium HGW-Bacteroidetes-13]|nr:MAG: transcriptional regulator [Bacteroidetes bacterium HGW-Bacteroidetes-13]
MINTEDFIKRLQILLQHYGLTASAFADSLDVQRSSVSHIVSGRNKPSLDFVLKILHAYPEVDLQWLLNGKGNFPKVTEPTSENTIVNKTVSVQSNLFEKSETSVDPTKKIADLQNLRAAANDDIEQIVIFYKNGQFKIYKNLH